MNYITKIKETMGLCLLEVEGDKEIKNVLNLLLTDDNRLDVFEMFLSCNFILQNIELLSSKQKSKFDNFLFTIVKSMKNLSIKQLDEDVNVNNNQKSDSLDSYMYSIKEGQILKEHRDAVYDIYIDGEKVAFEEENMSDEEKISLYFTGNTDNEDDQYEVELKKIKHFLSENYLKEKDIGKNGENFKKLKTNDLIYLLKLMSARKEYGKRNMIFFAFDDKPKEDGGKSNEGATQLSRLSRTIDMLDKVDNIKSGMWLQTDPAVIIQEVKGDMELYNTYKAKVQKDIKEIMGNLTLYPILRRLSEEKANIFTKEDVIAEFKKNKDYMENLNKLKTTFVDEIEITEGESILLPYIGVGKFTVEDLIFATVQEEIDNIVLRKDTYMVLMKYVDKNDDLSTYQYEQVNGNHIRNDAFIDVLNRNFLKNANEKIFNNNNLANAVLTSLNNEVRATTDVMLDSIEELEVLRKNMLNEIKVMKDKPKKISENVSGIISIGLLLKNEGLDKLKKYWHSLYDIENPKERALSLMLMHHVGKDIFKTDLSKELYGSEISEILKNYQGQNDMLFDFHFVHQNNAGKLLKLEKEVDAFMFTNFVYSLLDVKNRESISIGTNHTGRANRLGRSIRDVNYNEKLMEYVIPKSVEILKSIFDETPYELLTLSGVAPMEYFVNKNDRTKDVSYFDIIWEKVVSEPKYKEIWNNLSFQENIVKSNLSLILSQRGNVESKMLFKYMDKCIGSNKKEEHEKLFKIMDAFEFFDKKRSIRVYWEETLSELVKFRKIDYQKKSPVKKMMQDVIARTNYVRALGESETMQEYKKTIREIVLMNKMNETKKEAIVRVKSKI